MIIELPLFSDTSPALKNSWLRACSYVSSKIMALQYIYPHIQKCEKNVLSVDKLKSMHKKGKVHGEEY